jgi:hypothetical protein
MSSWPRRALTRPHISRSSQRHECAARRFRPSPRPLAAGRQKVLFSRFFLVSGRQDLNLRPPGPQPGALPDCATPRGHCYASERATGVEPVLRAWKAPVQPLTPRPQAYMHDTCVRVTPGISRGLSTTPALLGRHHTGLVGERGRRPWAEPVVPSTVQRHDSAVEYVA